MVSPLGNKGSMVGKEVKGGKDDKEGGGGGGEGEEEVGPLSWQERLNMALLVLLYALQGIPLGLTTGSLPFM